MADSVLPAGFRRVIFHMNDGGQTGLFRGAKGLFELSDPLRGRTETAEAARVRD